ncbi:hypothetical protein ACHAQA_005294 [Verticillium albo-atrum]
MKFPDLSKLPSFEYKPRIFILTDILNEPDDSESLVRYLLYANEFRTEGIAATTSTWLRQTNETHVEEIRKIVRSYGDVTDNLNHHAHPDAQYPAADELQSVITAGAQVYGMAALGGAPSDGAKLLAQRLEESTEPLYVTVWGGANTLAQALEHIHQSRLTEEAAELRSRLRVYTISDQDDTGELIRNTYPDIFYIASIHGWNMYDLATWQGISLDVPGADVTKVSVPWLEKNVQIGPLGKEYPSPIFLMEDDTPTFLYLIQNGLGSPENPRYGGWGGRYSPINQGTVHYADVVDTIRGVDGALYTNQKSTIYRWRDHYQNDLASRIQWSVNSDFWKVNHPPVPILNGTTGPEALNLTAAPGEAFVLDAGSSYDPDHPETTSNLEFQWYQYREPSAEFPGVPRGSGLSLRPLDPPAGTNGTLAYNDAGFEQVVLGPSVAVTVPRSNNGTSYHLILQVTSKHAELPLRRYLRVVIQAILQG